MRYFDGNPIKDLLEIVIKDLQIGQKLEEQKIVQAWKSTLGDYVAKNTDNIYIKDKRLFVSISSSILKQELFIGRNKIVTSINQILGKKMVEEIIFR